MINYKDIKGFLDFVNEQSSQLAFYYHDGIRFTDEWKYLPETCKLALVCEYLREEHGIDVFITKAQLNGLWCTYIEHPLSLPVNIGDYEKYNAALKAGIIEGIKLIESAKP